MGGQGATRPLAVGWARACRGGWWESRTKESRPTKRGGGNLGAWVQTPPPKCATVAPTRTDAAPSSERIYASLSRPTRLFATLASIILRAGYPFLPPPLPHHTMPDGSFERPQQRQFNPYSENGGTILAIAGADFSVIAGDTRQSEGYSIQTRYAPKVFRL